MASPAQIAAAKANAAHSTGPRTDAGKTASSRNALTHGATARTAVLPGESQADFDALLADTVARTHPVGEAEHAVAGLVTTTLWRYLRLLRAEAEFVAAADPDGTRPDAALATLFADETGAAKLKLLLRYLNSAAREYRAATTELRRLQSERLEGPDTSRHDPRPHVTPDLKPAAGCYAAPPARISADRAHAAVEAKADTEAAAAADTDTLPRAERRALERARRKAEKRARQAAWATGQTPAGFVSHDIMDAAA